MLESPPPPAEERKPVPTPSPLARTLAWLRHWPYTFVIAFSLISALTAIITAALVDRPITDPEGFLGPAYIRLPLIGLAMLAADVLPRAFALAYRTVTDTRDYRGFTGKLTAAFWSCSRIITDGRTVLRQHWSWTRVGYVAAGLVSFYTCYVSYRNLKSYLPLITDRSYDTELDQIDALLFFGSRPTLFLHDVLGTDIAAHILGAWYISYLPLNVLMLGAMVAWTRNLRTAAWSATALSMNWMLGVISYYMLPTLGPGIAYPALVREIEDNSASALQHALTMNRNEFVTEIDNATLSQGVAGFASLHVSVVFTVCLIFHRLQLARWIRNAAWIYLVGTVLATLYFGWHYVLDDVGGVVIAWLAVEIGAQVTRHQCRTKFRRFRRDRAGPSAGTGAVTHE